MLKLKLFGETCQWSREAPLATKKLSGEGKEEEEDREAPPQP